MKNALSAEGTKLVRVCSRLRQLASELKRGDSFPVTRLTCLKANGAKLRHNFRIVNYLRFRTPGTFLRILSSVIVWSLPRVAITLRLAAIALLATSYCSRDSA